MKQAPKQPLTVDEETKQSASPQEFEKVKAEADEWKNKCLRALADYQNLVKRTEHDKIEIQRFEGEVIVKKLLPVLDNFERAQNHIKDEGLGLALKEFVALLTSIGVEKLDTDGKAFDAYQMDCVDVVDGEPETVVKTVEYGYTMHGKVIRPAKVTVGKKEEVEKV